MKETIAGILVLLLASFAFPQDSVKERLTNSPRHQEWVDIKSGGHIVHSFLVYPQKKDRATAVLVIHENKGLTDWVRSVADRLAEAGYIAIAPDLLSGMAPKSGNTNDFPDADSATQAIYRLSPDQVAGDLDAVANTVAKLPACNGNLAVAGFCWGGGQSFRFATRRANLKAAFVFYGAFEYTREALQKIACPVYGFYAGNDSRINSTLPEAESLMKELHKTMDAGTYEGADHAFMRKGEEPEASAPNKKARDEAWNRWLKLLAAI